MANRDESHGHKKQWEDIEARNLALTKSKGDIYERRASACRRLLTKFC